MDNQLAEASASERRMAVPQSEAEEKLVRQATALFHQQIWCWGRDIESEQGNVLVQYGFQRKAKPAGQRGASIYRLDLNADAHVILRGFGAFFGDQRWGGMFLRRYGFSPQLTPGAELSHPLWLLEDLPTLRSPDAAEAYACRVLLVSMIDWMRTYEHWIAANFGIAYRQQSLVQWQAAKPDAVPAEAMASTWRLIGQEFSASSLPQETPAR